MTIMVYKHPGDKLIHNVSVKTKIINQKQVQSALKDGWFLTPKATISNNTTQEQLTSVDQQYKKLAAIDYTRMKLSDLRVAASEAGLDINSRLKITYVRALLKHNPHGQS